MPVKNLKNFVPYNHSLLARSCKPSYFCYAMIAGGKVPATIIKKQKV
jgi:hypothetical protein